MEIWAVSSVLLNYFAINMLIVVSWNTCVPPGCIPGRGMAKSRWVSSLFWLPANTAAPYFCALNSQGAWEFCSQFVYRPAGVINIYRKDRETVKKSFPGHSLTSSHGPEQQKPERNGGWMGHRCWHWACVWGGAVLEWTSLRPRLSWHHRIHCDVIVGLRDLEMQRERCRPLSGCMVLLFNLQ